MAAMAGRTVHARHTVIWLATRRGRAAWRKATRSVFIAGAIEPRHTGIFLAAWLEAALEETAGREEGRLGKG